MTPSPGHTPAVRQRTLQNANTSDSRYRACGALPHAAPGDAILFPEGDLMAYSGRMRRVRGGGGWRPNSKTEFNGFGG
jgi:hypothetical protein